MVSWHNQWRRICVRWLRTRRAGNGKTVRSKELPTPRISTGPATEAQPTHMATWAICGSVVEPSAAVSRISLTKSRQPTTYKHLNKFRTTLWRHRIRWIWLIPTNRKLVAPRKTSTFSNQRRSRTISIITQRVESKCWPSSWSKATCRHFSWRCFHLRISRKTSRWL